MTALPNLSIDAERLWDTLMETARFGGTAKGGVRRLTLSEEDRLVRDWFRAACTAAGLSVTIDDMGNMFARRAGRDPTLPPIAMGSHLDTQPTGGKFDGILGVLAALEVVRTLNDAGYATNAPIEIVNWTNEEGSRFSPAMLASGVFAGAFERAQAGAIVDRDGVRFDDALEAIGYRGDVPTGGRPFSAFFELHIEQGPILEAEGKTIGIVEGVQGMRWFRVAVDGRESHAGTTPMTLRRDALLASARIIDMVAAIAGSHPPGVGTVGVLDIDSPSINVIPGAVRFTVDIRHPDDTALAAMEESLRERADAVAQPLGVTVRIERIWDSPAVRFDADCLDAVRSAADAFGYGARPITSGAGHDAAYISRVAPTAMIFVPCKDGISHNESESATQSDCAAGANVLLRAVLEHDLRLAEGPAGQAAGATT